MMLLNAFQNLHRRPRRNRASPAVRAAFQETDISPANFVYPLFIHEGWLLSFAIRLLTSLVGLSVVFKKKVCVFWRLAGEEDTPIGAMPGCYRLGWRHGLVEEVGSVYFSSILKRAKWFSNISMQTGCKG